MRTLLCAAAALLIAGCDSSDRFERSAEQQALCPNDTIGCAAIIEEIARLQTNGLSIRLRGDDPVGERRERRLEIARALGSSMSDVANLDLSAYTSDLFFTLAGCDLVFDPDYERLYTWNIELRGCVELGSVHALRVSNEAAVKDVAEALLVQPGRVEGALFDMSAYVDDRGLTRLGCDALFDPDAGGSWQANEREARCVALGSEQALAHRNRGLSTDIYLALLLREENTATSPNTADELQRVLDTLPDYIDDRGPTRLGCEVIFDMTTTTLRDRERDGVLDECILRAPGSVGDYRVLSDLADEFRERGGASPYHSVIDLLDMQEFATEVCRRAFSLRSDEGRQQACEIACDAGDQPSCEAFGSLR